MDRALVETYLAELDALREQGRELASRYPTSRAGSTSAPALARSARGAGRRELRVACRAPSPPR